MLDPRLKASSGPRRLQYLYDSLQNCVTGSTADCWSSRAGRGTEFPALVKKTEATSVHVSGDYFPFGLRGTRRSARRWARYRWRPRDRRSWFPPGASRRTTARRTRSSRRSTRRGRRTAGARLPHQASKRARWIDPADVAGGVDIPDAGVELDHPAGEAAARKPWKAFVSRRSTTTPTTATGRITTAPAGCRRTSSSAPSIRGRWSPIWAGAGAQAYLRELAFRDFYANVLYDGPRARGGTGTRLRWDRGRRRQDAKSASRRGRRAGRVSRSSTPECANWRRRGSCTTACG